MAELRRERKVVSVLFVDLVGSTARAEALDPEDVEAELNRYYAHVRNELQRYGGTVEKFIGDAVVAVFGAPVTHEDDAERAVRAALAVRDWAVSDEGLEVRIGVHTGEALVRLDARPDAGEGIAVGDVVNTAARIQSAAPANGVLVGEPTRRGTDTVIEYGEARQVEAKGKAQPVTVFDALAPRARLGVDVARSAGTQFVGREHELSMLRGALARVSELREPQLVTLVGVPGIGKSRMVYELWQIVESEPDFLIWRQGRCLPYGDGVSLWAVAEMVKAQCGILETDPPELTAEKLQKTVESLDLGADSDWITERLRPLIGLAGGDGGQVSREEQFSAWRHFFEALADPDPAVLVFEDLHWADDSLLDFIDELADHATGVPLFIVCTARPELLAKRPMWGAGRTNALTLSLPPLSQEQTATLVGGMVDGDLSGDVRRMVLDRAEGNPLYAEEFARLVAERGDSQLVVPETVQGIIAARLDALAPEQKQLLHDAAVVGKVFWAGAVATLSGVARTEVEAVMRDLERRELVRRDRRSTVAEDVEYAFRHVLVRDVAYGQIPRADRADMHRRAAEWLGSLGRPEDYSELIAHHYIAALEYVPGEVADAGFADAAARGLRDAGDRATSLGAFAAGADFFGRALELTPEGPARAELMVAAGTSRWYADAGGLDLIAEGARLLEEAGRTDEAADALVTIGRAQTWQADIADAEATLEHADRLLAGSTAEVARLRAVVARGALYFLSGRFADARAAVEPELENIERTGRADLHARALDIVGGSRNGMGDRDGLEVVRAAVEVARKGRAIFELQTALNNVASELIERGALREAAQVLAERGEVFEKYGGSALTRTFYLLSVVNHDYSEGRWDDAIQHGDDALRLVPEGSSHMVECDIHAMLALIASARDPAYDAHPTFERAVSIASSLGHPMLLAGVQSAFADVFFATGATDDAVRSWRHAEQLVQSGAVLSQDELLSFVDVAVELGFESDALSVLNGTVDDGGNPWAEAAHAILRHDFAAAADLLEAIGHRVSAARQGLRAGGERAERAREFYRSAGAVRFLADGEDNG